MTRKILHNQTLFELSSLEFSTLDEIIKTLSNLRKKAIKENWEEVTLRREHLLDNEPLLLKGSRPETDNEALVREVRDKREKEKREIQQRKEYERLRKLYE